ncbi:hypothetical protein ONZ45_g10913 [Pleurotus djamor]|nr:hypothetical protein ONZ45_g10913 [Pleurotus djamor]
MYSLSGTMSTSTRSLSLRRALHTLPPKRPSQRIPSQRWYSSTSPPPTASRGLSTKATIALASVVALGSYTLGAIFPPSPFTLLFPRVAPPPPRDPDSEESKTYTSNLENSLQNLETVREHRSNPPPPSSASLIPSSPATSGGEVGTREDHGWYETRPYQNYPEERRVNNLTAGALRGPGRLALPPLIRVRKDESEAYLWVHLGRGLCGHDGIVHGGLLATLLDEALGRQAISNLPDKVGVTASLTVNYKAPTRADQFVLIKTKLVSKQGRKVQVEGMVEDLNGNILVQATALFVQPRYAKLLKPEMLKHAMGEPDHSKEPVLLADGEKMKGPHDDTFKHR